MKSLRSTPLLLSALCLPLFESSAFGAEATPIALPASTIAADLLEDESTVGLNVATTAGSRLGLTALETPASTTSLTGDSVRSHGDSTVQDAVARSPGITNIGAPGDGGTALSARGFTGQGSVMQLFDGTRLYSGMGSSTFPVDTWSVDRIDVLRGPASVLYGEGATGAVVNVIPKKPFDGEIRNRLRLGYGSNDSQQTALDSGGSLSDAFTYRLNLNQLRSNGWIDHGDSQGTFISGSLRWQVNEAFSLQLSHDSGDHTPINYFGVPLVDGHYKSSLRYKNYNVGGAKQHYDDQWTRLTATWQISDAVSSTNELYYLKSRRRWANAENYNWDTDNQQLLRSGFYGIKHNQEQVGDRQTFTIQHSLFGLNSQSLVGFDVNRIRFKLTNNSPYYDVVTAGEPIDLHHPNRDGFHSASEYLPLSKSVTRQASFFAENRTELTERLSLITGLRRDYVDINRDDLRSGSSSGKNLIGNNWKVGIVYELTPDMSIYGQQSTSTDGVGGLISLSPSQQQFDLATARQTEMGFKQMFWDQKGSWTVAAYHIVKKKLLTADPQAPRSSLQVGQQSSNGVEASLDLQLPYDWKLQANAALVKAKYDDFDQAVNGVAVSRSGNRPVNVPRRTANLWLDKAFSQDLNAGAGLRYVDARYADIANTNKLPSYTVVDAAVSWKALKNTTLGLQLRNVFDREYASTQYNEGQQWILGEPRSFYLTADIDF
ncbi:TonB-dependent receptor [Pseudomonas fontis]|uniref:TonB-dependent receptor n=1 Tax=Pseudomonas fontis TaxID=2942633 RepID=A0ABT5NTK5_9PSED|nr:TonB-dependent receptor [Pseudomonas fontis]MDD0976875.1 TonB-dependent receptor [Pseudomonas fontis]MDD0991476.1 TonB-dependent receptor [Pseudomonas fontis]